MMKKHFQTQRSAIALLLWVAAILSVSAADYSTFLTAERGFTEVASTNGILADASYCYLLTSAENTGLFVGVGRYEAKPDWAGDDTKALRYRQAGDPVADLSNFFTIEKEGEYIGLRNVVYHTSLFQTHNNAGFMYVLTYTEPTMSDWCYLKPTYQNGYWLFESGKYPISSNDWACGYLGPWNKVVKADEPIALNRRNTTGDEAGHYRLFRISRADLFTLMQSINGAEMTWEITNPSFETGDETGWTLGGKDSNGNEEFKTREYGMSNKDGNYLMNAYQWWAPSLSVSQVVENLPSGEYVLSGTVATWEGRTVTLSANENTVTQAGQGNQTGIRVSTPVTIGSDGRMTIKCESTAQWWNAGHEGETQTFFKLDDVQLHCTSLYLDGMAVRLSNNETKLVPGQWYYYETDYSTEYILIGHLTNIVYTTNGQVPCGQTTGEPVTRQMTLPVGRTYFKATAENTTLVIAPYRNMEEGTFTAVALNVDGLPNTIATIDLNPDGPGADGTKKISRYLASKNYDIIGCSEDFNYHGSLISSLQDNYSWGTVRATLSVNDLPWTQILQGKFRFDTDGLNLIWKNTLTASNESWTQWTDMESTDGNQYVKKGFRHYDLWLGGNATIDVYILHMDAGDTNATWSRESQWRQLSDAINNSDHSRAKLIIGDTNSRYTREDVITNFIDRLSTDFTMSDVWVEFYRNGIYPTTAMDNLTDQDDPTDYSKYEIVDKIIYINPTAPNTVQLTPQNFHIEQDYTYGHVDGDDNATPLGDHRPVVVTFKYQLSGNVTPTDITLTDHADNTTAINNANGVLANVTLQGRTLIKDGSWNTLCLPFNMTEDQVSEQLAPAALMELDTEETYDGHKTGLKGTTLYLYFKNANAITAGKPYIIKWAEGGTNVTDPVFHGVTVSGGSAAGIPSTDGTVTFQGTYTPTPLVKDDPSNLYLGTDNTLYWPAGDNFKVNAFRAYFSLSSGANVRAFNLNFIDSESTGIKGLGSEVNGQQPEAWHDLSGRRLVGQPMRKGIYIKQGRKVIIK